MKGENIRKIQQVLPSELMEQGISLEPLGIYDYGWIWQDALKVVNVLTQNRIAILGGDVYSYMNGQLSLTNYNWYIQKDNYESLGIFLIESQSKTTDYIKDHKQKYGENYCYSIVVYKFPIGG